MKKILLSLLASIQFCIVIGETIKMPDERVLREKLTSIGLSNLAKNTSIISQLAGQRKEVHSIAEAYTLAINDYVRYLDNTFPGLRDDPMVLTIAANLEMNKPLFLNTVLAEFPEALQELKENKTS